MILKSEKKILRNEWIRDASPMFLQLLKSCILEISWHLIIILFKSLATSSHCDLSTLVTVTFIGQMFYLSPIKNQLSYHNGGI